MNARSRILKNLNNRVYGVNTIAAVSGAEFQAGVEELAVMIKEGLVEEKRQHGLPLYILTFKGRQMAENKLQVVVDSTINI